MVGIKSAEGGNDRIDAGAGNDVLAGGDGNDVLAGGSDNDTVYGDAGDDSLTGDAGRDLLYAGTGNDSLYGGTEADTLDGDAGKDLVFGGAGDDLAYGGSDSDAVSGDAGNDTLYGGDGNDQVLAGDGNDLSFGDAGDDSLTGDLGADTLSGDAGNDTLFGGADSDLLSGDAGNDLLYGGDGNDSLSGGDGNDTLDGGAGDDSLAGGHGNDALTGGAGDDRFVFEASGGGDRITDFDLGDSDHNGLTNDQLDVSDLDDGAGNPVKAFDIVVSNDGFGNAVLHFPGGESITVLGLSPDQACAPGMLNSMGIPCFASGTRILTDRGERLVEDIRPGDLVATQSGQYVPVIWRGARHVTQAMLNDHPEWRPIRIRVGSFGNRRDLVVSPQHGLVWASTAGPRLVRAGHLAAFGLGARIARGMKEVTYHHLLLPAHDIVLAEGCPAESFYPGPLAVKALLAPDRMNLATALGLGAMAARDPAEFAGAYGPRCMPLCTRVEVQALIRLPAVNVA